MKRLFFLMILLVAVSAYGVMNTIQATELNAATYVAVTIPTNLNNGCNPIMAYTSDGTAFNIATDVTGADAQTFPANATYSNDCIKVDATGTIFWAMSSVGTPDMVVFVGIKQ